MAQLNSINNLVNQDFIEQLTGLFVVMDLESRFLVMNKTALDWCDFKSYDDMKGETYYNIPCKIAENHEAFVKQDELTRERSTALRILGYYCYAHNEWKILFGEKYQLKNKNNELIATVSHFNDITNYNLIDLSKLLNITTDKNLSKIYKKQTGYILEDCYLDFSLTKRQSECLFFLMRGKTSKEIAKILNVSFRTVEIYIDQVKHKLNCSKKSDLIEKAMAYGYMNIIPNSLFENLKH